METLGNYLQEERQKQGKTLEQIAEKTCISRSMLQTIEDDREDQMPHISYLRGFLKLYAQELGLNPDDVLARLPEQPAEQNNVALPKPPNIENPPKPLLKIFFAIVIVCIACVWAWQMFFGLAPITQDEGIKIVSPRPAVPNAIPSAATQPGLSDNESDTNTILPELLPEPDALPEDIPATAAEPAQELHVEQAPPIALENFTVKLIAHGLVWMKLQADKNKTVDITLRKGERYRISAQQRLTVRIGNPVLVDVFYNDVAIDLAGKKDIPLDLVFPDFLQ